MDAIAQPNSKPPDRSEQAVSAFVRLMHAVEQWRFAHAEEARRELESLGITVKVSRKRRSPASAGEARR